MAANTGRRMHKLREVLHASLRRANALAADQVARLFDDGVAGSHAALDLDARRVAPPDLDQPFLDRAILHGEDAVDARERTHGAGRDDDGRRVRVEHDRDLREQPATQAVVLFGITVLHLGLDDERTAGAVQLGRDARDHAFVRARIAFDREAHGLSDRDEGRAAFRHARAQAQRI